MAVKIKFDASHNTLNPTLVLARKNGDKLGVIPATNVVFKENMNSYSEMTFRVDRADCISTAFWNNIKDFKNVWVKEYNLWFEIYVDIEESDDLVKSVICRSLGEAELSQINLYDIEINTEDDMERDDYVTTYLYNDNHKGSILHRIMDKAPHYTYRYIAPSLMSLSRVPTFTFDGTSIYDAMQEIAEEFNILFDIMCTSDSNGNIVREIYVYDLESFCLECGHRGEFSDSCPDCNSTNITEGYGQDTTIFISSQNLADSINYSTDTDSVKNCFRLETGDDLMTSTVINCNPNGSPYIWYFSEETMQDMSPELVQKLNDYNARIDYYQNKEQSDSKYVLQLDPTILSGYNALVNKYHSGKPELNVLDSAIKGYKPLMNAYYDTIDFALYLAHDLMPNTQLQDTTASNEATKLTAEALSPVSVSNLTNASKYTVDSAVLSVAKIILDYRYDVKINNSGYNTTSYKWTGSFVITNNSDEDDTYTTGNVEVTVDGNYENFVKQKINQNLNKGNKSPNSIVELFNIESDNTFKNELKKYCLARLESLYQSCDGCLAILIEQGAADSNSESWGDTGALYTQYRNRLNYISSEIALRKQEIETIQGVYDTTGDTQRLVSDGLQSLLDKAKAEIKRALDLEAFLGEALWIEFLAFRREDTYQNSNFVSDGFNNAELFNRAQEFINRAEQDIFKSATLQHSISATIKNLLVIEDFKPLYDYFEIGNWLRLRVDDKIYKLRLINYEIDYENLDNISVTFSDVKTVANGISDIQSIVSQMSSISGSFDSVARQATDGSNGSNSIRNWVEQGLALTQVKLVNNAVSQDIVIDDKGILCRKYDSYNDRYENEQIKIINSTIAITDNNWESVKTAIGKIYYKDPTDNYAVKYAYGVNAEVLCGKVILGETLAIYNSDNVESNTLTFNKDGLAIKGNNNSIKIDPNATSLFTIVKNGSTSANDITLISFDNNGWGHIGGFTIGDTKLYTNGHSAYNTNVEGVYVGTDYIALGGTNGSWLKKDGTFNLGGKLIYNGSSLSVIGSGTFSGTITATGGTIGGFTITDNRLYDYTIPSSEVGINQYGYGAAFYAGANNDITGNNAAFRVYHGGAVYMTNATITGGSLNINNNFVVNASGSLSANNVKLKGTVYLINNDSESYRLATRLTSGDYGISICPDEWCKFTQQTRIDALSVGEIVSSTIVNGNIRVGGDDNDVSCGITSKFQGDSSGDAHYILCREKDGLTVYVGTNGSALTKTSSGNTRSTTLSLHGNTVKLSTASSVSSDERLKTSFTDLQKYEGFYHSLSPIAFKYNYGTSNRFHIGFKAQDVERALYSNNLSNEDFAGFVIQNLDENSEDYHGFSDERALRYDEFIALNTHMIQKALRKIEDLENQIQELQATS